ncbi:calcium/sodium antiporter [Qipengyuania flava]|uniref:calcium/sodium antiporter n=1 Tax=Qipengyuania flava TaxID=192812 RepID=UPI001C6323D4|nr:calcium/sodium antiporter [Qipengyuania flava]QYJ06252.1 calcium/sodium antiporter [Qipengyuania flava]
MTLTVLLVVAGLVALLAGGEVLVRGAVGLAERAGVTPLVIGLVIVGFGTSTPELVTSVEAALAGSPEIAWGNVVGSNIANTLLVLGAAALFTPIIVGRGAVLRDTGVATLAALLFAGLAVAALGTIWIGAAMLLALFVYLGYCYFEERNRAPKAQHNAAYDRSEALEMSDAGLHPPRNGWGKPILLTLAGFALLIVGGQMLVSGAIDLARLFGVSETLIGLTIVAIGTSMPELVTSLVAARKGEPEVAYGNVVGSNIYNILGIGGVTMMFAPGGIPQSLLPFDIGVMTAAMIGVFVLVYAVGKVGRAAGAVLLAGYAVFMTMAVLQG